MNDSQEKALIAEILSGEHDQFRYLVERYHRGLIQHLYNMTGDGAMSEDLAQEAFIRSFNKLGQYNPQFAFSTWLYKIADNLAYRAAQKQRPTIEIETVHALADTAALPGEEADLKLTRGRMRQAVQGLEPNYREVITMYYWQDHSYEEIAQIMGRPVGTIRTWLHRAKDELRKVLDGQV